MFQPNANAVAPAEPAARIDLVPRKQPRAASSTGDEGFAAVLDRVSAQRSEALRALRRVDDQPSESVAVEAIDVHSDPAAPTKATKQTKQPEPGESKPQQPKPQEAQPQQAQPQQAKPQQAQSQRHADRESGDAASGTADMAASAFPAPPQPEVARPLGAVTDARPTPAPTPSPAPDTTTPVAVVEPTMAVPSVAVPAVPAAIPIAAPVPIIATAPPLQTTDAVTTPKPLAPPPAPAPIAVPSGTGAIDPPPLPTAPAPLATPEIPVADGTPDPIASPAAAVAPAPAIVAGAAQPASDPAVPVMRFTKREPAIAARTQSANVDTGDHPKAAAATAASPETVAEAAPMVPSAAPSEPVRARAETNAPVLAAAVAPKDIARAETAQLARASAPWMAADIAINAGASDDTVPELAVIAVNARRVAGDDPGGAQRNPPVRGGTQPGTAFAAQLARHDDGAAPTAASPPAAPPLAASVVQPGKPGDAPTDAKTATQDDIAPARHTIVMPPETAAARIEGPSESAATRTARMQIHPVIAQVAVSVTKAAQDGVDRITIKLQPPELGRIDVRLEVGVDGRIQAVFAAERPATVEILQRDVRELERALQSVGLSTDAGSLSFGLKQNGGQNANGYAPFERHAGALPGPAADGDTAPAQLPHHAAGNGRIDIHV